MLKDLLKLKEKDIVSIVGSGGKTTTMYGLARELINSKVLITTSTKIFVDNQEDFVTINNISKLFEMEIEPKIYLTGNTINNKKFTGITNEQLEEIEDKFDNILIEADGSRNLPLKGWRENEPVILNKTNKILGIIPINIINSELDKIEIFERNLFMDIVGKEKKFFDIDCIYNILISKKGIFKDFKGEKILLLNKCDKKDLLSEYYHIKEELEKRLLDLNIRIIIGSSKKGVYYGD